MNSKVLEELLKQTEHEFLDFKKGLYGKLDILGMANAKLKGS